MVRVVSAAIENNGMPGGDAAPPSPAPFHPFIIATVATSSNAGNSVVAASVARGLSCNGAQARVVKIGDSLTSGHIFKVSDALFLSGLVPPARAETCPDRPGSGRKAEALVIEISRGLLHSETTALLGLRCFRALVSGVVLASGDSYGAAVAIRKMNNFGLSVLCVSGVITSSPVALREARAALKVPVLDLEAIRTGGWLPQQYFPAAATKAGYPAETVLTPAHG